MSVKLIGGVIKSSYGERDPNVRLLFIVIADEHGSPRQKDPDGWVRLSIRELADRVGCDHATIPDVIDRAEDDGLKVDWPGPNRKIGYMLPGDLYPEGEHTKGRPRPRREKRSGGTSPPVEGGRSGGMTAPVSEEPDEGRTGGTSPPEVVAPAHHVVPVRTDLTRTSGERAPEQRPARADPGEPPPDPLPGTSRGPRTPRQSTATNHAADNRVRAPATVTTVGRAPPRSEAALVEPLTLEPTQGAEMGNNGETHEQTLAADGGPGPQGEEHRLEPARAGTAATGRTVEGSSQDHPDDGDRGGYLYRGGGRGLDEWDVLDVLAPVPAEPLEDEPVTVKLEVGLDVVLVKVPCAVCGGRGWHTAGGGDPMACGACPAGEAWYGADPAEDAA